MQYLLWDRIVLLYVVVINIVSFAFMGIDKKRARKHQWRIPEKVLFLSALLGGSAGAVLGMRFFHHKTRHWYFVWGMPAILVVQVVLAVVCIYYK